MTVSFRDLNLSTPAGAATLYRRIKSAAESVCGYEETDFRAQISWRACVRRAVDDAVAKVNSPQLTALHTGRSPAPVTAMLNK